MAVESGTGRGSDSFLDKHHIYSAVDTVVSVASQHGHLVQWCYKHEHQCLRVRWTPGVRHATLVHGHPSTHKCSVHPPSNTLILNSMFPTSLVLGASYCSYLTFGLVFERWLRAPVLNRFSQKATFRNSPLFLQPALYMVERPRPYRHLSVRQRCQRRMGRFPDVLDSGAKLHFIM